MVTPVTRFNIEPFWGDAYKHLDYEKEPFNNPNDTSRWLDMGFADNFVGSMCDMRKIQPVWNNAIIAKFEILMGWQDVCTSYYRMDPGTILPKHHDTYKRYIEIFELEMLHASVFRAIIFLEDWQSGHYLEVADEPVTEWKAGDVVTWWYDTPHLAANMGYTPRYTLQITGHV
jgi:hypothetical protein